MLQRPTVMISSTARDLPEHRKEVQAACERASFAPHEMMENLDALNADAIEASLTMVDKADVYIGIFAFRYGYVPDGRDISVTEMEYNRAVELDKPRLLFFWDENTPIPPKLVEKGEGAVKLEALKERAAKDRVSGFFESPAELRAQVISSLHTLKQSLDTGAKDPVEAAKRLHRRTPIPTPPTPYVAHPYTLSQTRDLVGRRDELNALTDWVTKPGSPAYGDAIFCFVAIGGMGKSALNWKWFNDIAPQEIPDLAGRLWWSFYESDAYFENFLNRALCYVGELHEDDVQEMPWQDREALLLQHLSDEKYLIVLDGLERILLAYNRMDASSLADDEYDQQTANVVAGAVGLPASAAQSFTGQHRLRQTTDLRADHFFRKLAQVRKSRILISTRLYPFALQLPNTQPYPGCFPYFLKGLSDDDAIVLWRQLGVSGSRQELVLLFNSFENHSLLIQALAGEIARDRKTPGEFAAWRKNNPSFDPASLPATQVKSHILQHAMIGLDKNLSETLTNIVSLRMPATYDTLEALIVGDSNAFEQRQALDQALTELEDRGLIGWDREANRYDAHPIVRAVAMQSSRKDERQAVYSAMETYFRAIPVPDYSQVETLADLTPAIERYHTLLEMGRFDDAFGLFSARLQHVTLFRLAAHRDRIAWLERLFPNGTNELPRLNTVRGQSSSINSLAMSYQASGRPGGAASLLQRMVQLEKINCGDEYLWIGLLNLGDCCREIGSIRDAADKLQQSFAVIGEEDDRSYREGAVLYELGRILGTAGHVETALLALLRALKIKRQNNRPQMEGLATAYLAELKVWQGHDVTFLSNRAWSLATDKKQERDFIRAARLQGLAALAANDIEYAEERLNHGLTRARAVNLTLFELPALVSVAKLELAIGNIESARAYLDEVWEPAEEGPYPLYQADAYNVLADICIAEGDKPGAIEAAVKAYRAAWCDGPPWAYHWGLEKAKAHLRDLRVPEPDMPPFDESKFEPLPEVEINPKDDYWVDPNVPLEALLDLT